MFAAVLQFLGVVAVVVAACMVALPLGVAVAGVSFFAIGVYLEHR